MQHDFGEKELTLILRSRILMYCIDFLWLQCIGLVFLGMVIVCCFYFSVSRTHCSVHFPMEVVMVSLLSINDIKPKMYINMQNGSTLFYLFLGEFKLSGI